VELEQVEVEQVGTWSPGLVVQVTACMLPTIKEVPVESVLEKIAQLAASAVVVVALAPGRCPTLALARDSTCRRQLINMLAAEVISMQFVPGEISHVSSRLAAF